jgi:stage III sporulation protein AF
MMAFLSDWIRGLISVVLFAVVLDMILPSNNMQRYARLVMGTLIILMMLSPVLKLSGKSVQDMDFSIDTLLRGGNVAMSGLESIQAQGEQLRMISKGQTVEQWKAGITAQVTAEVEKTHGVTVERVDIEYAIDDQGQPKTLDRIHVVLAPRQELEAITPVDEVEEVVIGKPEDPQVEAHTVLSQQEKESLAEIRLQVATDYQLPKSNVTVVWKAT